MPVAPERSPMLVIPPHASRSRNKWFVLLAVVAVTAGFGAWRAGLQPKGLWAATNSPLTTLNVDEGEMIAVVIENGTLESSSNTTVRCEVEALVGQVSAGQGNAAVAAGGGRQAGGAAGGAQSTTTAAASSATKARAGGGATKKVGATKAGASKTATAGATTGAAATGSTAASGSAGSSGGTANADGTTTVVVKKPTIRSFSYQVAPYVSLRPKTVGGTTGAAKGAGGMAGGGAGGGGGGGGRSGGGGGGGRGGGGGGGGRGGGGGGGAGMGGMEKMGSTRIIKIVDEGSKVTKGDVVCEFDAFAFKDELQAQQIRWAQAKAWVDQAKSLLEVNEISYREYKEGILPQDAQLINQYLITCRTEADRAEKNYIWSKETAAKGYRAAAQVKADELNVQQTKIALTEAEGMVFRLENYTKPRLLKSLEAKIEAIKSDKLAQESSFQLETVRLKKLETMVEKCVLRAPRDGVVVYANQPNAWGRVDNPIDEGVTVREGQAIFNLPDPGMMRVRARINESKVAMIHTGMKAIVVVDAFPDTPLMATVAEVTPIPAPANGPSSDVQIYYASVDIDSKEFKSLRPGLSAEVTFLVSDSRKVTRVPLQAIRWFNNKPYAAVAAVDNAGKTSWQWHDLKLGESDPNYAEVVYGLTSGEKVMARPDLLPEPRASVAEGTAKTDKATQG